MMLGESEQRKELIRWPCALGVFGPHLDDKFRVQFDKQVAQRLRILRQCHAIRISVSEKVSDGR